MTKRLVGKFKGTAGEFLEAIGESKTLPVTCTCDENNH